MSHTTSSAGGGIGLFGLMFLLFLTLKLVGKLTWSWWWVTAPLWGGVLLGLFAIAAIFGVVAVAAWVNQ